VLALLVLAHKALTLYLVVLLLRVVEGVVVITILAAAPVLVVQAVAEVTMVYPGELEHLVKVLMVVLRQTAQMPVLVVVVLEALEPL